MVMAVALHLSLIHFKQGQPMASILWFKRVIMAVGMAALASLLATGCEGTRGPSVADRPMPVLLISIDGFRYDYFDLADTPALDRLVEGGLKADSLHHSFPTKTFPTHYTVVTGLYPGRHGVVANSMWDPIRDSNFSLGNRDAVGDGYWYEAGEPIWVTAHRQGLRSATYFWPSSEARIHGVRPNFWKPYDGSAPHADRIEQVLAWFDLPEAERPDLVTLYFSSVDSAGHRYGPRAEPVQAALEDVDHHLGNLFDGLEQRGWLDQMHVILVSDHGMSFVDFDRYIMLDDYLDLSRVRVSDWGPAAQIWATDMPVEEIVAALDGAHPNLRVWTKEEIPARYRFDQHHRVPDVLAEADLEWMISNRPFQAGRRQFQLYGMHGWDPALLEMHGALVVHGPAFEPGSQMPSVRAVDLYSLMASLLGIEAAEVDGSLDAFAPYLHADPAPAISQYDYDCGQGQALKVRVGGAQAALHWQESVHVLDALDDLMPELRSWADVDVMLTLSPQQAEAMIDGRHIGPCYPSR